MRQQLLLPAALAVMAAAMLLAACGSGGGQWGGNGPLQPPQVTATTVHREAVPIGIELPGRTSAQLVAQVRARVDGIVVRQESKDGSEVKAGQRLYKIDPAPYVAALKSAEAVLQKAQANLAS
ncbi:MAG TPA: biotin/lipoyl-binding protein, partial [Burkholderiaceae bacterium]|nr:biotin/lipoyl-binding protein [Burkholderiaceae bacterium]